jgi:hypothetical protein
MFSLGVFPPRRTLPQLLSTFFERAWNVLRVHDEFAGLTTRDRFDETSFLRPKRFLTNH